MSTPTLDRRLVGDVADRLADAGIASPWADARLLVEHALAEGGAGAGGRALLEELVERRRRREPLQHVLGRTWFRELELLCRPGVFVPRPETEIVAGLAVAAARRLPRPTVVEPCCGTGAVALSVAVEVPGARVVAADVDPAAVALCRTNLDRVRRGLAGVAAPPQGLDVTVVASDLLDGVDASLRGAVDVLVANPPYLPARERSGWEPEVRDHDPRHALVGGEDGHEVVEALLARAPDWLAPGGTVVVEIDERRGADAVAAAGAAGLAGARRERDLTGADRAVVAHRPR